MQKSLFILAAILMSFISQAQFKKYIVDSTNKIPLQSKRFVELNGKMLFDCERLWQCNGSDAGTHTLSDSLKYTSLVGIINGKMVFKGFNLPWPTALYAVDGQTGLIQKLHPRASALYANGCAFKNKLFFAAEGTGTGVEIWYTDGTSGGTGMLADVLPGTKGSFPTDFIVYKNKMYFGARTTDGKNALWETDGTERCTIMVKVINTKSITDCFLDPVIFNNKICFTGTDSNGIEPWVSDGTAAGTFMLADIDKGSKSSIKIDNNLRRVYTEYKGNLYFIADTNTLVSQIWRTDGTKAGTVLFKQMEDASVDNFMEVLKDKLFFLSYKSTQSIRELWMTGGNINNTSVVQTFNINSGVVSGPVSNSFTLYNNYLYFIETNGGNPGTQIWRTDAGGNTQIVLPAAYNHDALSLSEEMFVYNNKLYFNARYDASGKQLWSYEDPTASVTPINYTNNITIYPNPARNSFTISAGDDLSGIVTLRDIAGRTILSKKVEGKHCNIALPQLPAGVYNADIETNGQHTVHKLVIE